MTMYRITRTVVRKEVVQIEAGDPLQALSRAHITGDDCWDCVEAATTEMDIEDVDRRQPCGVYLMHDRPAQIVTGADGSKGFAK